MIFRKGMEEEEIGFQMAPMIDCVFQLLVFFMCISTISNMEITQKILLPVADKTKETELTQKEIMVNVDTKGMTYIQGLLYNTDELIALLNKVKEEQGFVPRIVIRGDRDANFNAVLSVMKCCTEADIWDVSFATYQIEPAGGRQNL